MSLLTTRAMRDQSWTLLALETEEKLHVVRLLTVHHRLVVYVGIVLDKDQVSSTRFSR